MKVPPALGRTIGALFVTLGLGTAGYVVYDEIQQPTSIEMKYVSAIASKDISDAIKLAMVLGFFFESSNKVISVPYLDKHANPPVWTVCNGITSYTAPIQPHKYYSEQECVDLEISVYKQSEKLAIQSITNWDKLTFIEQATIIDFIHNLGIGNFNKASLRKDILNGNIDLACEKYTDWVYANKIRLAGLVTRREINKSICLNLEYAKLDDPLGRFIELIGE